MRIESLSPRVPPNATTLGRFRWRLAKVPFLGVLAVVGLLWIPILLAAPIAELLLHIRHLPVDVAAGMRSMTQALRLSCYYGAVSTAGAVLLSIPLAIVMSAGNQVQRGITTTLTLAPLFVNLVLRVYAVRYLSLEGQPLALAARWFDHFDPLVGTDALIIIGLAYTYLPFAVVPLAVSLDGLPIDQLEAGASLGLRKLRLFRIVGAPALARGIAAAFFLTFVPTFGDLLVFRALGGSKKLVVAEYLYIQAIANYSPERAALGVAMLWLFTSGALLGAYFLQKSRRRE